MRAMPDNVQELRRRRLLTPDEAPLFDTIRHASRPRKVLRRCASEPRSRGVGATRLLSEVGWQSGLSPTDHRGIPAKMRSGSHDADGAMRSLAGECPTLYRLSHTVTERGYSMPPKSLAEFELLVMLAAVRLGPDEAYTVSIAEDIARRTGRTVRRANVYTTLQRLETKELVSTQMGDPRPERGGRPRRLVTVQPEGLTAVRVTTEAIQAMVGGLTDVIAETA